MEVTNIKCISPWSLALNAARKTVGKKPIDKEPSNQWKAKMLLSEHSPIRLVQYYWTWENIPMYVTVHLVRHHIGCEKFVTSQRPDRTGLKIDRSALSQTEPNSMDMFANAQEIMNISKVRLCNKASKETREAWVKMLSALKEIDPVLASKCVPSCIYRGFCPELQPCGYSDTKDYQEKLDLYRSEYIN